MVVCRIVIATYPRMGKPNRMRTILDIKEREKYSLLSKSNLLALILTLLYLGLSVFGAIGIVTNSNSAKDHLIQKSIALNFENRLLDSKAWLAQDEEWEKVSEIADYHSEQAGLQRAESYTDAMAIALISLIYLVLMFVLDRRSQHNWRIASLGLITVATTCLAIGISTPILEISAFIDDLIVPVQVELFGLSLSHEFSFEGRMYFYYQCKSVLELIKILLEDRNYVVGISIFCFSILIPFLKLGVSLIMLFKRSPRKISAINRLVLIIGKWSMADVFVAGAFLAFLAFNNMNTGIRTESHTLLGLYYFFAFVVISVLSSYCVEKHFKMKLLARTIESKIDY